MQTGRGQTPLTGHGHAILGLSMLSRLFAWQCASLLICKLLVAYRARHGRVFDATWRR